jgi:hypothetical protein
MPYAIVLFLDKESEQVIRRAWEALAAAGISSYLLESGQRPHVTFAVCEEIDWTLCEARLERAAQDLPPFRALLTSLGAFPADRASIFLAATVTRELLDLHERIHAHFESSRARPWPLYLPGHWIPHVTLAMEIAPDQIPEAMEIGRHIELPLPMTFQQIGLFEFEMLPRARQLTSFRITGS